MKDEHHSCCGQHGHSHEHGHHHHHHGHGHEGCCGKHNNITHAEEHFLTHLVAAQYMPVAQFVVKSSKQHSFETVALSPVFLDEENASMERVKEIGRILLRLEHMGFIDLDFDIPLDNYEYSEYKTSQIFAFFKKTVEEGSANEGFLGDIATLECGSIAPTEKCIEKYAKA